MENEEHPHDESAICSTTGPKHHHHHLSDLKYTFWDVVKIFISMILFVLAGLAEIGGGYLIWIWLKEGKPLYWGVFGGIILVVYGIIPTFQRFPSFGRVYAAYGGIFIILAVFWGWLVDKKTPDLFDWIGALICLIGASIILWVPRH